MKKSISATVLLGLALAAIMVFIPSPGVTNTVQVSDTIYQDKSKKNILNGSPHSDSTVESSIRQNTGGGSAPPMAGEIGSLRYASDIPVIAQRMNTVAYNESKRYLDIVRKENPDVPNMPLLPLALSLSEMNNIGKSMEFLFFSSPIQYDKLISYGKTELQLLSMTWQDAVDSGSWPQDSVKNGTYAGPLQFSSTFGTSYPAVSQELGLIYTVNQTKRVDVNGWPSGDRWNLADIYNTFWGVQGYLVKSAITIKSLQNTPNAKLNDYSGYSKIALLAMSHNAGESVLTSSGQHISYINLGRVEVYEYANSLGSDQFISALQAQIIADKPKNKDEAMASAKKVFNRASDQLNPALKDKIYKRVVDDNFTNTFTQYPVRAIACYIMLSERYKGGW